MLNLNMIDYKWRTFAELPSIENVVFETPFETHRFHAIGAGEVATAPGPTAVLMAVSNAIGMWLHQYPVTPERILEALGRADRKSQVPISKSQTNPNLPSSKRPARRS
jgi:xanthine dehydrogenase molybdenum-binding subunit